MEHNLVDEFHFWLCPVVAGNTTQRLFEDIEAMKKLKLVKTTPLKTGLFVLNYASTS